MRIFNPFVSVWVWTAIGGAFTPSGFEVPASAGPAPIAHSAQHPKTAMIQIACHIRIVPARTLYQYEPVRQRNIRAATRPPRTNPFRSRLGKYPIANPLYCCVTSCAETERETGIELCKRYQKS